jgi:hypothetical protein
VARTDIVGRGLGSGRDLADALRACAASGFARIPRGVDASVLRRLRPEIEAGPFRRFRESFGRVRQQIDGFDVAIPSADFPVLSELCHTLGEAVRAHGRGVRGLATWSPNEVGVARYEPGSIGITPHMDGRWYRRLVVVLTVHGRASFAICASRDPDDVVERWTAGPGDLVLMRGPGLAGRRDGRPFHLVEGPRAGRRLSLGIRMSVRSPSET